MPEKLKDYQVLDVQCGGTFYKVRHKITNNIFTWKAINCSNLSDEELQRISQDVSMIKDVVCDNLLRYYDTILHRPSKTLYFVLEYNSWRNLDELISLCKEDSKYIAERFIWYLMHELASVCKAVEDLRLNVLQITLSSKDIFIDDSGEIRVNCFTMPTQSEPNNGLNIIKQVGDIIYNFSHSCTEAKEFFYSDDLTDVLSFLSDDRNSGLKPDVVLYHPTVLANLETLAGPKNLSEILLSVMKNNSCEINLSDSQKAVELCKSIEPAPRNIVESPIYGNISPKKCIEGEETYHNSLRSSLSPTVEALALELPGFVPRCRKPYNEVMEMLNSPQRVTERTLSQQWMSRLIALRQREESLNQRERDILAKELINSPNTKFIPLRSPVREYDDNDTVNGITLPPLLVANGKHENTNQCVPRRSRRHSQSVCSRARNRKTYAYEDLDSSLSADQGDGSIIVTATKFTKENMPRRNIFPEVSTKKVHFTSSNPFAESDESVTLTFYELDNVDGDGYQVPRKEDKLSDITKFKYLDLDKMTSDKRAAMNWEHSSPSKQAKLSKKVLSDITNSKEVKRTPSKSSLLSKMSDSSQYSSSSSNSQCTVVPAKGFKEGGITTRTRSSVRLSLAPPCQEADTKKVKGRKSLLPFKTPFKFMSSK